MRTDGLRLRADVRGHQDRWRHHQVRGGHGAGWRLRQYRCIREHVRHNPIRRRRPWSPARSLARFWCRRVLRLYPCRLRSVRTPGERFRSGSTSSRAWSPTAMPSWTQRSMMPASQAAMRRSLFSFKRTIGSILESAGASNTPAAREAFVQTMLASFAVADGSALNPDAGVLMPLDGARRGALAADRCEPAGRNQGPRR